MKVFVLKMAAGIVRMLAALAGVFARRRDGIAVISCQDDKPSQDILELEKELKVLLWELDRRSPHGREVDPGAPHNPASDPGTPHIPAVDPGAPHIRVVAGRMRRSAGGAVLFIGRFLSMLRAVAASRVVVIDAFCPAVSIPKKQPWQKVVQIWHAPEAIKKFSLQILDTPAGYKSRTAEILCMHRGYDYILCPADATRPFFSEAFGYPENVFVKYGLPSLDRIGLMKRPAPGKAEAPERVAARSEILTQYPVLQGGAGGRLLTVVYAPTFRDGAAVNSAGLIRAFTKALQTTTDGKLPGIALVLKLHPLDPGYSDSDEEERFATSAAFPATTKSETTKSEMTKDSEPFATTFFILNDKKFILADWHAAADVIITDYSGVAVEAAAAGVASYYYIYDIEDYKTRRGLNVDLREEAVGKYAFLDADALALQVLRDFSSDAYDYEALAAFGGKYLETPVSGNTRALAAFIAGLI